MSPPSDDAVSMPVTVALFLSGDASRFQPTLRSLRAGCGEVGLVLGVAPSAEDVPAVEGSDTLLAASAAQLITEVWSAARSAVLVVTDPVVFPRGFLDPSRALLVREPRVATVSFLSNSAAHFSFPHGIPMARNPEGEDEQSITHRLRTRSPSPLPVLVPYATGAVVLLSPSALGSLLPFDESPSRRAAGAVADMSLRAGGRGLFNVLDVESYCGRTADIALDEPQGDVSPADAAWLGRRHPWAAAAMQEALTSREGPLSIGIATARTKVLGLRVLIDGTTLGPTQMGTQVTILALIEALAARDDVAEVGVVLATDPPEYARDTFEMPKVRARRCAPGDFSAFGTMDIGHRPFQPDQMFDIGPWQRSCGRVVISILDLIGYQIGIYYDHPETWTSYREALRRAASEADGVTTISADVAHQVNLHMLPVDPSRLFVIPYGTEHLHGDEPARCPAELVRRGFAGGAFALCLGTNYAHKNRDLALRAHTILRQRGHNLSLVLAGAFVPWGSSRREEARVATDDASVLVLPDIDSEERNWLLRHAELVLYPTSAEGFGLVPFEAARFGTPTVHADFGPLREFSGVRPVNTTGWSPEEIATAAQRLLEDPALARAQVEGCLNAGADYTWAATAERLTTAYRAVIAAPPRWLERSSG